MKKYKLFGEIILLFLCIKTLVAQESAVDKYTISFSRNNDEKFELHVECSFIANKDSLCFLFGDSFEKSAISNLFIESDNLDYYHFDRNQRNLIIKLKRHQQSIVKLSYDYVNITSAVLYRDYGCEFWEISFQEYYYPFLFGDRCSFLLSFRIPENLIIVNGYDLQKLNNCYVFNSSHPIISHSCVFAFLNKDTYQKDEFAYDDYTIDAYYKIGIDIPLQRKEELAELTKASIRYFSNIFEPYENRSDQIKAKPIYIFHGNGYCNRNNLNIISASLDKFISKPNIFPLIHEIGHRWLGEWTLLIPDGAPGAYFIKESLNEYMTLLFIKHYYGKHYFTKYY